MKLTRKSIGRIAASFVATAMLATMAIVPASAADPEVPQFDGSSNNGVYTVEMQKVLTVPANVYAPNATFSFTATAADPSVNEVYQDIPVEKGVDDAIDIEDVTYTSSTAESLTKDIAIKVTEKAFTHAGVYKYTLAETQGNNANIKYDGAEKTLYVIVVNEGNDTKVNGVVVYNADKEKSETFTNAYGENTTDKDTLSDLTLSKTITGNAADMTKEFAFTVSITNETEDNQVFKYWNDANYNGAEDPGETGTITANSTSVTFNLGSKIENDVVKPETVKIYGLRAGDEYTIEETNANANGYITTINAPEGATINNDDGTVSGTMQKNTDVTVAYTNSRTSSTPTGIMMDIAPYAVLVVIAAAGCFIFLRKRHAKED